MNDNTGEWTARRVTAWALLIAGAVLAVHLVIHAIPVLIMVAVILGPPVWVYLDATRRGIDRAPVWALLVLLSNVLGLVIYLIARPDAQLRACPACGVTVQSDWQACPACGGEIGAAPICGACGRAVDRGWRYCPSCKEDLRAGETAVSEVSS